MTRRWFIISFFVLLVLCTAAWIAGFFRILQIRYVGPAYVRTITLDQGALIYSCDSVMLMDVKFTPGWSNENRPCDPESFIDWYKHTKHHFIGFAYTPRPFSDIWIPVWFPSLLSVLLLYLTWRKAAPTGRGFPIEVAASQMPSKTKSQPPKTPPRP